MVRLDRAALLGATVVLAGCGLFPAVDSGVATAPPAGATKPAPKAELSGLALEAQKLLEADQAFAARSLEVGAAQAFHEFLDEKGMQLPPTGDPVVGRDPIRERLQKGPPIILSWEPRYAEVFAQGRWGWTWGEWQAHEPGAGGKRVGQGKYVNLWKKQSDGRWKVRLDVGNSAP